MSHDDHLLPLIDTHVSNLPVWVYSSVRAVQPLFSSHDMLMLHYIDTCLANLLNTAYSLPPLALAADLVSKRGMRNRSLGATFDGIVQIASYGRPEVKDPLISRCAYHKVFHLNIEMKALYKNRITTS